MKAQFTDLPENQANILFQPSAAARTEVQQVIDEINSSSTATNNEKNYNMDVDQNAMKAQRVRCCLCGVLMPPNTANTCLQCLKSSVDITEGISKTVQIHHCKECNRYQRPPWVKMELESA